MCWVYCDLRRSRGEGEGGDGTGEASQDCREDVDGERCTAEVDCLCRHDRKEEMKEGTENFP